MSMSHTGQFGFTEMRNGDVTGNDTLLDGVTANYTWSWNDKPSYAIRIGPEYNVAQIYFGAGVGYAAGTNDATDALPEAECAFQIDGWFAGSPCFKICDGSVQVGECYISRDLSPDRDATDALACCSITLDDEPHMTSIVVSNVDGTDGISSLLLDTLGMEWISVTFPDNTFPINAYIRPY